MAKRFFSTYKSTKNVTYTIEIWDTSFSGTATSFEISAGGFSLNMAGQGDKIMVYHNPTDCQFDFLLKNDFDFILVSDLRTANEGRFTIKISKGATSPTPYWYGQIIADIGGYSEEYYPQRLTIRATDGIGILKTIDFNNAGVAYTGKERALFVIKEALKKLPYVPIHYGSADNFINTVLDVWALQMTNSPTTPCALYQSYIDQSVWQKYDKGDVKFTSCYEVIQSILTPFMARLTQRDGLFWIENIFYRTETNVLVRTYTRDGGMSATNVFGTLNDINQTANGALLAVGEYEFFPALREVSHVYNIRLRKNFLESSTPLNTGSSLVYIDKPINNNNNKTTLRLTGNIVIAIKSLVPIPTIPTAFEPFCIVFRIDLNLDTVGLARTYNVLSTFQVQYGVTEWATSSGFFIAVRIDNADFLKNLNSNVFSLSQYLDIVTPVLPQSCEDFSIAFNVHTIVKYSGGTYSPGFFEIDYQFNNPWLEAYSYGTPALTDDDYEYKTTNTLNVNNSAILESESIIGTSSDPNAIGALWVKPASTYELATLWQTGVNTPNYPIEYLIITIALSGQYAPTRKLQGTIYGSIDRLARFEWDGVFWLFLGGTWNADMDELSGEWVELKYDQNFTPSPVKKKKYVATTASLPYSQPANGQGGPTYEMVANPPGTLTYASALTTSSLALLPGVITTLPISETLTDGDVHVGDTISFVNPLTGAFDELTVTATSVAGQTAIAVSGTLSTSYPANAPIIKKPKIGTFSLPVGTTGDILYFNGTQWIVKNIGSTGQVLTVVAGIPAWAASGSGGYTDEQAQDAVGGILVDTTEIDLTYNDTTPSITADIKTNSVLFAKLQQIATARFLGRVTAGTGNIEALTAAQMQTALGYLIANQTITLSGDVTGSGTTAITATIANDAVTYAKIQNVSVTNRILGRITAGAGDIEELTAAQIVTLISCITGSGTVNYLPKFTGASAVGDSQIFDNGTNVGIGTITPGKKLDIIGNIQGSADLYLGTGFKLYDGGNLFFHKTGSTTTNMFLGYLSGGGLVATGVENIAIGNTSAYSLTTGTGNTAIGKNALLQTTTGAGNIAIGASAGQNITTGNYNLLIGNAAGFSIISGIGNTGFGFRALIGVTNSYNTGIGYQAFDGTNATESVAIGMNAGNTASAQTNSVLIGAQAGKNATAATSVFLGYGAGYGNTIDGTLAIDYNSGLSSNKTALISGIFASQRVGINTPHASLVQTLNITGTARITGSDGTPISIMGRDADGDISSLTLATGLSIVSGALTAAGLISGLAATRIPFATGANALTDDSALTWDNTNKRLVIGSGTSVGLLNVFSGALSASTEFLRMSGNVSNNMIAQLINSNNTTVNANAFHIIAVGGPAAGDPFMQFVVATATTWAAGIDNSAADSFKITNDTTPGGTPAKDMLVLGTNGLCAIGGGIIVGTYNLYIYGNGGLRLPSGTTAQQTASADNSIRNNTNFGGLEFRNINGQWHRVTCTTGPSNFVAGTGAGTAPVISYIGTDRNGELTIVTSAGITANADIVTVTYGTSYSVQPYVSLTAYNAQTASDISKFYISSNGNGSFTIKANGTLSFPATYKLGIIIQQ